MRRQEKRLNSMKAFGHFIRGKGFEILFLLFSVLSVFYVSNRMGRMIFAFTDHDFKIVIFVILFVFSGYMLLYTKCGKEKKSTRTLYLICSVVLCFLLYLVLSLWIYDLANLLFHIEKEQWYLLPMLCSIGVTCYGFIHAKKLYVKKYEMELKGCEQRQNIVLLSDIHVGTFVDFQQLEKIVSKVNELHPDQILIAGDLFDVDAFRYCDKARIADILRGFRAQEGVYAVLGNHDPNSLSTEIRDFYQNAKIHFLVDDVLETEHFILVGRDDITTNPNRKGLEELLSAHSAIVNGTKPKIVLDHNPLGIKEAAAERMDLIVCGHTHKGQFFPANVFTKMAYGKEEYYGFHKEQDTYSVISSGAGFFQMPMRIGSNSEIVLMEVGK